MQEQEQTNTDLFGRMTFDVAARQHIRSMANWAMIVSITAFVGYVISILQEVFLANRYAAATRELEGFSMGPMATMGSGWFGQAIVIIVGIIINVFLFRFSSLAKAGIDGLDQDKLNRSFGNLKSYFTAVSIVMIIIFLILLVFLAIFGSFISR